MCTLYIFKIWWHYMFFILSVIWDRYDSFIHSTAYLLLFVWRCLVQQFVSSTSMLHAEENTIFNNHHISIFSFCPKRAVHALLTFLFLEAVLFWGMTYILSLLHKADSANPSGKFFWRCQLCAQRLPLPRVTWALIILL